MLASAARMLARASGPVPSPSFAPRTALALAPGRFHCQVPCGIFTDDLRVKGMMEDAQTIRKSVVQIADLHKAGALQDMHQLVRWIATKEEHSTKIMTVIGEYFLAQKVKKDMLTEAEYKEVLVLHHAVMVAAMKTKQSTEIAPVDTLDAAIAALAPVYAPK
mmetsp:Transcript_85712/g.237533  ORF Transcript_85712/g.237533 Transcript_85712/m.237533 type:complete len:162 (-) Transcript_85712:107-592(-)